MLIAADVGGTKTCFMAVDVLENGDYTLIAEHRYWCNKFPDISSLLSAFISDFSLSSISHICLALPGPIVSKDNDQQCHLTNLDWFVSSRALAEQLCVDSVFLLNDFQAAARGIERLSADHLDCLHSGVATEDDQLPKLVVGAGTGLGVAPVVYGPAGYEPLASEGGHMDFAPANALQAALLDWMWGSHSHVSYERIVSGPGIEAIYRFCCVYAGVEEEALSASQVHQAAMDNNPQARLSVHLFIQIYAAYIGNIALLLQPAGGIYIAGGVAVHLQSYMHSSVFLNAYYAKGRMRKVVEKMPIYLVLDEQLGVKGALAYLLAQKEKIRMIKNNIDSIGRDQSA